MLKRLQKKETGFTLIELVVVMAIIAVLSVLIIGAITIARRTSIETANRGSAKSIQTGLEAYYAKNKQYPATSGNVTFKTLVDAGGSLNGMVTLQGAQCTAAPGAGVIGQNGGYVEYTATGYIIHVSKYDCSDNLETITNS